MGLWVNHEPCLTLLVPVHRSDLLPLLHLQPHLSIHCPFLSSVMFTAQFQALNYLQRSRVGFGNNKKFPKMFSPGGTEVFWLACLITKHEISGSGLTLNYLKNSKIFLRSFCPLLCTSLPTSSGSGGSAVPSNSVHTLFYICS